MNKVLLLGLIVLSTGITPLIDEVFAQSSGPVSPPPGGGGPKIPLPSPDEDRSPKEKDKIEELPRSGDEDENGNDVGRKRAPIVISGENVYIVWWNNGTGNDEVMFRASNDGGTTFTDKINLSNNTNSESQDAELSAEGGNVIVTWWERNATSNEPILRMSTDNGQTFGPILMLSSNGTIGE